MSGKTIVIAFVDLALVVAVAVAAYLAWSGGGSGDGEQEAQPGEFSAFHLTPLAESELQPGLIEPRALERTPLSESELRRSNEILDRVFDQLQEVDSRLLLAAFQLLDWSKSEPQRPGEASELVFICRSVGVLRSPPLAVESQVAAGEFCRRLPSDESKINLGGLRVEILDTIHEEDLLDIDAGEVLVAYSRGMVDWATAYRVQAAPAEDFLNGICLRVPANGFGLHSSPPFGEPYTSADAALVSICDDVRGGRASDLAVLAERIIRELAPVLR